MDGPLASDAGRGQPLSQPGCRPEVGATGVWAVQEGSHHHSEELAQALKDRVTISRSGWDHGPTSTARPASGKMSRFGLAVRR